MKEAFDKLTSYNIFNYLFPGIIFILFTKYLIGYNFIQENNLLGAILYYFIGMVISRIGSVIIEPILKKINLVKFENYKDFVLASRKDIKIELLSEVNNTYRTLLSTFTTLIFVKVYSLIEVRFKISIETTYFLLTILLFIMFLFSYRKQTNYISKRIKANN